MDYQEHLAGLRARVDRINETARRETRNRPNKYLAPKWPDKPKVLEGFACLYDVPHWYGGRYDIFQKDCFRGSLFGVFFLIDHEILSKKLGDQDDGNLELTDTGVGLAFRLKLAPGDLERLDGRSGMSPKYIVHDAEIRKDGTRVIKAASLFEISACHIGAIRQTHAVVRDADTVGSLADDAKSGFASDAAATAFLRALKKLEASI
jgi:phage head maturation protease